MQVIYMWSHSCLRWPPDIIHINHKSQKWSFNFKDIELNFLWYKKKVVFSFRLFENIALRHLYHFPNPKKAVLIRWVKQIRYVFLFCYTVLTDVHLIICFCVTYALELELLQGLRKLLDSSRKTWEIK